MKFKYLLTKFLMKFIKFKFVISGVPVIIKNSQGEILLGKRATYLSTYPGFWGLPGGIIDYNETLIETAKREVKEELGIDIKVIKKSNKIYECLPKKECPLHSICFAHYAKIIKCEPKPISETSEIKWFKPSEIRKMNLAYNHKEILKGEGII